VIPSQNEKIFRIFDLISQQQTNRLQALLAAIHIVAEKKVVGSGREATVLEKAQQVVVLAVNIAADFDGRFELEQHWLR